MPPPFAPSGARAREGGDLAASVPPCVTSSATIAPTTGTSWKPWPEKPKTWNTPGALGDGPMTGSRSSVFASMPAQARAMRTPRTAGKSSVGGARALGKLGR